MSFDRHDRDAIVPGVLLDAFLDHGAEKYGMRLNRNDAASSHCTEDASSTLNATLIFSPPFGV